MPGMPLSTLLSRDAALLLLPSRCPFPRSVVLAARTGHQWFKDWEAAVPLFRNLQFLECVLGTVLLAAARDTEATGIELRGSHH